MRNLNVALACALAVSTFEASAQAPAPIGRACLDRLIALAISGSNMADITPRATGPLGLVDPTRTDGVYPTEQAVFRRPGVSHYLAFNPADPNKVLLIRMDGLDRAALVPERDNFRHISGGQLWVIDRDANLLKTLRVIGGSPQLLPVDDETRRALAADLSFYATADVDGKRICPPSR